jgi:hypothetical protein
MFNFIIQNDILRSNGKSFISSSYPMFFIFSLLQSFLKHVRSCNKLQLLTVSSYFLNITFLFLSKFWVMTEECKLGLNPVFIQATNLHITRRSLTVGTAILDHCFITGRLTARDGSNLAKPKPMNSSTIKAFHKRMPFSKNISFQ